MKLVQNTFPDRIGGPAKPLITTHPTLFYQVKDMPRELKPPWPSSRVSALSSLSPSRPHICGSCQPLPQQSTSLTKKLTSVVALHQGKDMVTKAGTLHVTPVCSLLLQHIREKLWGTARPASLLPCPPTLLSGKNVRPDSQRASKPDPQIAPCV